MSISILNRGASGGLTASIIVNGLSEADTVTASNGSKTKNGVWTPDSLLPSGFTTLDYIESTGTQYIDTNIKVSADDFVSISFLPTSTITSQTQDVWFAGSFVSNTERFHAGYYNNEWFTVDGFSYNTNESLYTASGKSAYAHTTNFYLFKCNGLSGLLPVRIYHAKIGNYREFIPAKRNSDGEIGLYDLVEGKFYGNNGTGEFVAGRVSGRHEINGITDLGLWTVTATDGERTKTQDVLIEVIGQYTIAMEYKLWLYNRGDQCTDVTGGYEMVILQAGWTGNSGSFNADHLYSVDNTTSGYGNKCFISKKTINTKGYTKLKAIMDISGVGYSSANVGSSAYIQARKGPWVSGQHYEGYALLAEDGWGTVASASVTNHLLEADISEIDECLIGVCAWSTGYPSQKITVKCYEIWLE